MRLTLAAFCAIAVATPPIAAAQSSNTGASAQTSAPSRMGRWDEYREREQSRRDREQVRDSRFGSLSANRQLSQQFGSCTVDRDAAGARSVVTQMLGRDEVRAQHRELLSYRCFGGSYARDTINSVSFPSHTLHMILADALVRQEFPATGPVDFAGVPSQVLSEWVAPATAEQLSGMSEQDRDERRMSDAEMGTWYVLERLGECVARRSPNDVRALAQLPVATPEERAQLTVLQPAMAACLPPGTTIRLSPADARGSAVLAYYRLAHASPSPSTPAEAQP